jgi:hypothetical protein
MTVARARPSTDSIAADDYQDGTVSVVVVAICSLQRLRRTLEALQSQEAAPAFDVVVAADPELGDLDALRASFPAVAFLSREGCRTPIELTTLALNAAKGERILLTEDSCLPHPNWVGELVRTPWYGRAAVGGVVEPGVSASPAMWAFYYVDFFRYMRPAEAGVSPSLSVCNVAYHRSQLDSVHDLWAEGFHETEIHRALQQRFGPLYLCTDAEVRVRRNVRFADAVYERYAFGRLFGATRVAHASGTRRAYYLVFAPALPILLMARMTARALGNPTARVMFVKALPSLLTMVAAWSWGEWLGYLTERRPKRITTAPELDEEPRI